MDECAMVHIPVWSHAEGYGGALDSAKAGVHLIIQVSSRSWAASRPAAAHRRPKRKIAPRCVQIGRAHV